MVSSVIYIVRFHFRRPAIGSDWLGDGEVNGDMAAAKSRPLETWRDRRPVRAGAAPGNDLWEDAWSETDPGIRS